MWKAQRRRPPSNLVLTRDEGFTVHSRPRPSLFSPIIGRRWGRLVLESFSAVDGCSIDRRESVCRLRSLTNSFVSHSSNPSGLLERGTSLRGRILMEWRRREVKRKRLRPAKGNVLGNCKNRCCWSTDISIWVVELFLGGNIFNRSGYGKACVKFSNCCCLRKIFKKEYYYGYYGLVDYHVNETIYSLITRNHVKRGGYKFSRRVMLNRWVIENRKTTVITGSKTRSGWRVACASNKIC